MSENSSENPSARIESNQVTAEAWLLPEVNGKHVVTPEKPVPANAGFHARNLRVDSVSDRDSATTSLNPAKAMTQSRLDAIVHDSRQQGYESGRAEGYEKGYAEGAARAMALGQEQTLEQKRQLAELIDSVTVAVAAHNEQAQVAVIELIAQIAQQLCYRELKADNSSIAAIVKEAMSALPVGEAHIQLHVNPTDKALLESMPEVIKPEWNVIGDAALQAGGCRIETENSLVDFSISTRMQKIIAAAFGRQLAPEELTSSQSSDE